MQGSQPNDILAIDVDAEIRKLGSLRLRSAAEQVVELVRFVCSAGANRVDIQIRRRHFIVKAAGVPFDTTLVGQLVTVADTRLSQEQRHGAVVALERGDALGLLAAFAPGTSSVTIEWTERDGGRSIELVHGRPPAVSMASGAEALSFTLHGPKLKGKDHQAAIARACRFASVPIFLDGKRVNRGLHLEDCLLSQQTFAGSSPAIIGLPWRGELCRIVRLSHGILSDEALRTPQRGLLFHAVVDEKRAAEDLEEMLRRACRRLYSEMSDEFSNLSEEARRRAFDLLIERAEKSGQERLLEDVAGFIRLGGEPLNLKAIVELALRGGVYAIGRGDDPKRFSSVGHVVLIVDDKQRLFLERHLDTHLPAPPPQARWLCVPIRLGARLSAWRLRFAPHGSSKRLKMIPESQLSSFERLFCERLWPLMAFMARGTSGRGASILHFAAISSPPVSRIEAEGGALWILARNHRLIGTLVRGVAADPNLAYPALAALESLARDGHEAVYDVLKDLVATRGATLPSCP
jgi:hypothetical protein